MSDDVSYNGWFVNLFTKEGRAENKEERADRLRARQAIKGQSSSSAPTRTTFEPVS